MWSLQNHFFTIGFIHLAIHTSPANGLTVTSACSLSLTPATLRPQVKLSSCWPSICAFSQSLSSPMLQRKADQTEHSLGKWSSLIPGSHSYMLLESLFLNKAHSCSWQLEEEHRQERILGLFQPLNRCQNLEYVRRSLPLLAGKKRRQSW